MLSHAITTISITNSIFWKSEGCIIPMVVKGQKYNTMTVFYEENFFVLMRPGLWFELLNSRILSITSITKKVEHESWALVCFVFALFNDKLRLKMMQCMLEIIQNKLENIFNSYS